MIHYFLGPNLNLEDTKCFMFSTFYNRIWVLVGERNKVPQVVNPSSKIDDPLHEVVTQGNCRVSMRD